MTKKLYSWKLEKSTVEKVRALATKEGKPMSRLVDEVLTEHVNKGGVHGKLDEILLFLKAKL